MVRRWWVGGLFLCLLTPALLMARQGLVKTNDGRFIQGDIDESSPDGQTVDIKTSHGVTISMPRAEIASIDYGADSAAQFHSQLGKLDPNDVKGRLELGRWALDNHEYDLAREAARDVEDIQPGNAEASSLLNTIGAEQALESKRGTTAAAPAPAATQPASTTTAAAPAGKYLTKEDVYAIRRAELEPEDKVRVRFMNDVSSRYLGRRDADVATFASESATQQAMDIIESGDPQLAHDVIVEDDPGVLLQFATRIEPHILTGCAASGCHGETGSGGFFLYRNADQTAAIYTNFYILQQTSRKLAGGETFGAGAVIRPMIDRLHPEASLILQFGLPAAQASIPHPAVPGWRPMYRGTQDPLYGEVLGWIKSLRVLGPSYQIKYETPAGSSAKPAPAPIPALGGQAG